MADPVAGFDVSPLHDLLNQVDAQYNALFEGHVPDERARFGAFLDTVRMIADQSADRASKGE